MTMIRTTLLIGCLGIAGASQAFLANGSFETGTAYTGPPNNFVPGTPAPWIPLSFSPDMFDNSGADGFGLGGIPAYDNVMSGVAACHGRRFIGFAASNSLSFQESFGQVVSGLHVGQLYTVTACVITDISPQAINFGGPYDSFGTVELYLNGTLLGAFAANTLPKVWQPRSVSFTAHAGSGMFELRAKAAFALPPTFGNSYMGLDDLQVVPEPLSLFALSAGVALCLRRRSST